MAYSSTANEEEAKKLFAMVRESRGQSQAVDPSNFGEPDIFIKQKDLKVFNTFLRARKSTRTIESELDIEGFEALNYEDSL